MEDSHEAGKRIMRQLLGDAYIDEAERKIASGAFGVFPAEHAVEACFGTIWARPGLDLKSRSIATISMVMALRDTFGLKNHLRAGLRLGITPQQLAEIAYQAIPYLGYPVAGIALRTIHEVLTEEGLVPVPVPVPASGSAQDA